VSGRTRRLVLVLREFGLEFPDLVGVKGVGPQCGFGFFQGLGQGRGESVDLGLVALVHREAFGLGFIEIGAQQGATPAQRLDLLSSLVTFPPGRVIEAPELLDLGLERLGLVLDLAVDRNLLSPGPPFDLEVATLLG
jgi:hypothetical protein